MIAEPQRLRALVEAGIAISSELSLDAVLQRLIEVAAELTGARYGALGVIDRSGRELERFITTGVDQATHEAIGELPHGGGILGVLIREARPLRLRDIADDPRSVGFPPNHPPMKTFLGVPVALRGVAYGNLYLTEKEGGAVFDEQDEEIVTILAAQAAVAIENARLYESATRWLRQLEALNEVGNALLGEIDLDRMLELIATRVRELVGARLVVILRPRGDALRIDAVAGTSPDELLGREILREQSKAGRVLERRRRERVDSMFDDFEVDRETARMMGSTTGIFAPMLVRGEAIGIIAAHDKEGGDPRFSDEDLRLVEAFAVRAAVAADLSQRVAQDALRRVVEAQEQERRRLARELHDETGQALTSVLLGLRAVEDARDEQAVRDAAAGLRELVVSTLQDVRRLAVELRPKALDDFGLSAALERLAQSYSEQTGLEVDLEARLPAERLPPAIETTVYRVVQEALTNVAKHADAQRVSIVVRRRGDTVNAVIEDDGRGFQGDESRNGGVGLLGMRERLALVGGRLRIESGEGAGTTVAMEVPLR